MITFYLNSLVRSNSRPLEFEGFISLKTAQLGGYLYIDYYKLYESYMGHQI